MTHFSEPELAQTFGWSHTGHKNMPKFNSRETMFLLQAFTVGLEPAIEEWSIKGWPYQRPLQVLRKVKAGF